MVKLNGLPLVKFSQNIATKELQNLIKDASSNVSPPENAQSQKEKETEYLSNDVHDTIETQFKHKRVRENGSPTRSKSKKRKAIYNNRRQTSQCKQSK